MAKKELLKELTSEQIEKVKECKSSYEIIALAKTQGVELTSEQLEAVSGGACSSSDREEGKNKRKIDS